MVFLQTSALVLCSQFVLHLSRQVPLYLPAMGLHLWHMDSQSEEFLEKVSVINRTQSVDCQKTFPLFQTNSRYDDSAAVSLRYVLTRDRMTTFFGVFQLVPSVVLPAVFLVISWLIHVRSMDIRTSQTIDRSRRHHTVQFTFMSHRS